MKKISSTLVTSLFILTFSLVFIPGSRAQISPQVSDRLSIVFDSICTKYHIRGASAALLIPGSGIWKDVHGESHNGIPITPDMYFGMGSNTKTHMAALLLKMQEQGLLSLDDTIGKWIQGYPNINGQVTIRQCLNHTSGLYDYFHNGAVNDSIFGHPAKIWSRDEILQLALAPNFAPGTGWSYSNTNYIIAGIIISKVMNKSPFAALNDLILAPAGLNHTFNYGEQGSGVIAHPWSKVLTGAEMEDMTTTPFLDNLFSMANSAGALVTTAEENVQFWHKLTSGQILDSASWNEMKQTVNIGGGDGYGLGLFRYNNDMNGKAAYEHGGTFFGFINENMVEINSGITISVLTNQDSIYNNILLYSMVKALHKVTIQMHATGVEKISGEHSFVIYPNPANDRITIRQDQLNAVSAVFVDITGKERQVEKLTENDHTISTEMLLPGLYFVFLQDKNGQIIHTQKLQIVR